MKKFFLFMTLCLVSGAMFLSCKDDDGDKDKGEKSYYTYGSDKIEIKNGYCCLDLMTAWGKANCFVLTSGTLTGESIFVDWETNLDEYIELYVAEMGVELEPRGGDAQELYLRHSGKTYDETDLAEGGTVQVDDNGDGNYTIKLHCEIDGKKLDCEYTGQFATKEWNIYTEE
ncbi:hypothetical protein LJC45_01960 [Alistipes sp. OttesenSCG-928-B03]|nr:hypothetical protein [Alistipes sp. OttesenSCG-928-B03]